MAKPARPGAVKTRLIGPLTPEDAASVHAAMLQCVLARIEHHLAPVLPGCRLVLALAEPYKEQDHPRQGPWQVLPQGQGDLGARIEHVWRQVGSGPAIFFGVDSPDVPEAHLRGLARALTSAPALVGPVADGGYWMIAAHRPMSELLRGIDWGSSSVYHQTLERAVHAGISLLSVARWFDVDDPGDLDCLRRRIERPQDPHLAQLRDLLNRLAKDGPS